MIDKDSIHEAVMKLMAKEILEKIQTEHRDAILTKSITKALSDWAVEHEIQKAIADRATAVVNEMLQEPHWKDKIVSKVLEGLNKYTDTLPDAIQSCLIEAFHGKRGDSTYDVNCGGILKYIKKRI